MKILLLALLCLLSACAAPPRPSSIHSAIREALGRPEAKPKPPAPEIQEALLPPLRMEMPQAGGQPIDQRFDLSVANAPAAQVFNSLVSGTRYSMLVHPGVTGAITINLKDVTIREALDSIRELYGYEYKVDGSRIFIQQAGIQTRVFRVNYLSLQRRGLSQLRVTSSSTSSAQAGGGGGTGAGAQAQTQAITAAALAGGGGIPVGGAVQLDSSRVTTNQEATFWSDLCEALAALAFPPEPAAAQAAAQAGGAQQPEDRQRGICNRRHALSDRSIVVSPHSGVIVIRATQAELRAVENYLRATQVAVERQVMLEAKVIEVTLKDEFQSGINWAFFSNRHLSVGQASPGTLLQTRGSGPGVATGASSITGAPATVTNPALSAVTGRDLANHSASGSVFGLALQTASFAALLTFLETQGNVQVLSSPRVATLNNQKAVLKVGDEQLFVTRVTVTPGTPGGAGAAATPTTVSPDLTPYFSGIVLDVTPQIDDAGMITLHIHPTINNVAQVNVVVTAEGAGSINVPTARSTLRETDSIVRVADGSIVAIGGLMSTALSDARSGLPGTPDNAFFRSTNRVLEKKELVILLKPTILDTDSDMAQGVTELRGRIDDLGRDMGRPRR